MTDTQPTTVPLLPLDQIKVFLGDLARPFALYATAIGANAATVIVAYHVSNPTLEAGAIFMGAVYAGLGALYGAKAWEVAKTNAQAADVEKAKVGSVPQ